MDVVVVAGVANEKREEDGTVVAVDVVAGAVANEKRDEV